MGGQNTYIPLKVNQSGVIPIIFASSILLLPAIMASFLGDADPNSDSWWQQVRVEIQEFVDQYILNSQNVVYISLFAILIIAFAYFYNSIAFDPVRQADQIRRQGGFIPGVRPGPQTGVHRHHRHPPLRAAVGGRRPALPVRRHERADLGRCGARADASDRQPTDAPQLRRIP
jgi:hypothetical protein